MLVFSALCPHPPILIPSVGGESTKKIKKTIGAIKKIEDGLFHAQPEIILIVSPHGPQFEDSFCINLAEDYQADFEQFGDLNTKLKFKGDLGFAHRLRESSETSFPVTAVSEPKLDHGSAIPLFYLTPRLPQASIAPITYSLLDFKTHFDFGYHLKEQIFKARQRIAVIASGVLSHRLSSESAAGFSETGLRFDKELIKLLKEKRIEELLKFDPEFVKEAGECAFRSLLILLGILNHINYQSEILSYEAPFGSGYLVANFKLP